MPSARRTTVGAKVVRAPPESRDPFGADEKLRNRPTTATLDTNVADSIEVTDSARRHGIAVSVVTLTDRELEASSIQPITAGRILETAVFDEGRWDHAAFSSELDAQLLEQVLAIISNGAFPAPAARSSLSGGQRRQLRDAMILMAHVRERRDVFVSNDSRAFIRHGRRERLEALLGTRIATAAEFRSLLTSL